MEPRKNEQKKDEQLHREERQRPRCRPALERLEERIAPSGLYIAWGHGGGYPGGHGHGLGYFA